MKADGILEVSKNLSGLTGALAAVLENHYELLPINPVIRKHMLLLSCIAALLTGFGAYRSTLCSHKQWIGWLWLAVFFTSVFVVIALTHGLGNYVSPVAASYLAHIFYMLCFAGIGGTVGTFLEVRDVNGR